MISRYWWLLTFLAAAILWSIDIGRPVDLPSWHEFDYSAIARNFLREGNNIFYPRIDWRGDGPGFTEMEFPVIPWVMAQLYLLFGTHEMIGRMLSLLFMLASLAVFRKLALKVLAEPAALIATLFFAVSHEIAAMSTAIQPESLMLFFYLLAVYLFVDWYEEKSWISYGLAMLAFAAAVLVKSPAAHLAIFFFIWALIKDGWQAFRRPSLYLFAALSFAPALLWYLHAASLFHQFHNSMGVSNEDHWIGLDLLRRPKVLANLLGIELVFIFGGGGVLVVVAAIIRNRFNSAVNQLALSWCAAVAIYLVVILRTSAGYWASYYHVVAVPPMGLLFGAGVYQLCRQQTLKWRQVVPLLFIFMLPVAAGILWLGKRNYSRMPGVIQDLAAARTSIPVLAVLIAISIGVTVLCLTLGQARTTDSNTRALPNRPSTLLTAGVLTGCCSYFLISGQLLLGSWENYEGHTPQYDAASAFKAKIVSNSLIVATGGICSDASGHRVANDAPDMFYWLNRKGFTTCAGQQSIAELRSYAKRGAEYFVADTDSLEQQPGLEAELRRTFLLVADAKAALLFKLTSAAGSPLGVEHANDTASPVRRSPATRP